MRGLPPSAAQTRPVLAAGHVLHDRYQIQSILGRGGMGVVYEAWDLQAQRSVAVKELVLTELGETRRASAIRQFQQEAAILQTLNHPHLPAIHDSFAVDGNPFLVMERVQGVNLEEHLLLEGNLPEAQVLGLFRQLAEVLQYLHTHRPPVIFRDLKPSNVMITPDEEIRLIDFGIAKLADDPHQLGTMSAARGMVSPGYAAPEQYAGGTDAASDLYALGATVFFLLTRQRPPDALDVATGRTVLPSVRELRPDVSERTAQLVEWLMRLGRQGRPSSAQEVLQWLARPERPVPAPPLVATVRPARPSRNWTRRLARPAALAFLLFGLFHCFMRFGLVKLSVDSSPPGARVLIDGRPVGVTPLKTTQFVRGFVLTLELEGYRPLREPMHLSSGSAEIFWRLRPGATAEGPDPEMRRQEANPPTKGPGLLKRPDQPFAGRRFSVPAGWLLATLKQGADSGELVLTSGDGQLTPAHRATLSVGAKPDWASARARLEKEGWVLVNLRRTNRQQWARFERQEGPLQGRALLLCEGRSLLEYTCVPCPDPFYFTRHLDIVLANLGFTL